MKIVLLRDHLKETGQTSAVVTILGVTMLKSVMTVKGDSYQGGKKPFIAKVLFGHDVYQEIFDVLVPDYEPAGGDIVKIALDTTPRDGEVNPDLVEVVSAKDTAGNV